MIRNAIRLLKRAILVAIGRLGYAIVKLPKEPLIEAKPPAAGESRPQPSAKLEGTPKTELEKAKQKGLAHSTRICRDDLGLDFLEPLKTYVHLQHRYRQELRKDHSTIRIIGADWLKNIGQIAHLDIYFKLKALQMLEPGETIICLDGVTPANQSLLSYYTPLADRVVPDRASLGVAAELMEFLEESTVTVRLIDGRAEHYHSLFYDVGIAWQQQARPPLVSLRPKHRADGRRWLSSLGLPNDAWFATFHCRTTAKHHDLRSVSVQTYERAMEAVVRAGGWVVCMGSDHEFAHPKIINRENHRTLDDDWKDVFLLAACRFFVGCTSGPADVVNGFGVPSIKVNTLQIGSQAAYNHDLFIMKLFRSRQSGRLLTIAEILEHVGTAIGWQTSQPDALGLDVVDNAPEEIEAVVREMIERLDGTAAAPEPWEEVAQQRLREFRQIAALGQGPIMAGKSRMGRDFLRRHAPALGLRNV